MPHTHQHDTRYKASRVEEIQTNTETPETQPTSEMEVATNNNIETRPEEAPQQPEIRRIYIRGAQLPLQTIALRINKFCSDIYTVYGPSIGSRSAQVHYCLRG